MLRWLAARPEQVFILTETSAGAGTAYLLDRFRQAGYAVVHTPDANGDRGTAIVSRIAVGEPLSARFATVTIPGRVAAAVLDTDPAVAILGVYVPSRDRSVDKTEKKEMFVRSLLRALDELPPELRDRLVLGGDYNVIGRQHRPLHPGAGVLVDRAHWRRLPLRLLPRRARVGRTHHGLRLPARDTRAPADRSRSRDAQPGR